MEDFTSVLQKVLKAPAIAPSFSDVNSNMELLHSISAELNHPLSSHVHGFLDCFSSDGFSTNPVTSSSTLPPYSNEHNHQSLFRPLDQMNTGVAQSLPSIEGDFCIETHEKNTIHVSEFADMPSSPGFGSDKNNGIGGKKRKRKCEGEVDKPREVIHVRAKRGQATDSHSLAERVRRERINEKLRVLQDLVPGCYKTMGMAVMLDVIINYVRSLQNQIEFLSMKLSAASLFYDFNSPEAEVLETLQRTTNPFEVHEMEKMAREEFGANANPPRVHSTWPF